MYYACLEEVFGVSPDLSTQVSEVSEFHMHVYMHGFFTLKKIFNKHSSIKKSTSFPEFQYKKEISLWQSLPSLYMNRLVCFLAARTDRVH